MGTNGNEEWDKSNAAYDLAKGNLAGAKWAEQRLSYDERKKGRFKKASLAYASGGAKGEKWKRYSAVSKITGRRTSVLARPVSYTNGAWNIEVMLINDTRKGFNDLSAPQKYRVKALTPVGAIQKVLLHIGNHGFARKRLKYTQIEK